MGSSLNKVSLLGRVGKDPEAKSFNNGGEIVNLSLATSESWKDKSSGEKKEKVEWHKVVISNPGLIGVVKSYVKKGSRIYLEGSLQTRKWADNGVDKYITEVMVGFGGNIILLDSKGEASSAQVESRDDGDSIPF